MNFRNIRTPKFTQKTIVAEGCINLLESKQKVAWHTALRTLQVRRKNATYCVSRRLNNIYYIFQIEKTLPPNLELNTSKNINLWREIRRERERERELGACGIEYPVGKLQHHKSSIEFES